MDSKAKLIVIAGPTCVGKTELSVNLAEYFGKEIISADSRQVYNELEIGTAKPSSEELNRVRHHFINCKSIHEYFSAGRFEVEALEQISRIQQDSGVFVVGGSGLYIRALCEGIDEMPPPDFALRARLSKDLDQHGLSFLQNELKDLDPETWAEIDVKNPKRVIRALEVIYQTGKKFSNIKKGNLKPRNFNVLKIGLELPREELFQRINQRCDIMLKNGLLEEVESLIELRHLSALQTVGYKEFFEYFDGEYELEEGIRLFKRNSRRYAKRQMTWFKNDADIEWYNPNQQEEIKIKIEHFLNN